jgi:hypothetical protein
MYVLLSLITIFLIFLGYINWNIQKGTIYIIPEGYKGKLSIVYSQKDKPALEEKDGYQVVKFPLNGLVKTSSHPRTGKQKDKYFFYTAKDSILIPAVIGKNLKLGGGMSTQKKDNFIFEFWIH